MQNVLEAKSLGLEWKEGQELEFPVFGTARHTSVSSDISTSVIMGSESSFQQQNFTVDLEACIRGQKFGFGEEGRTGAGVSSFWSRATRIRVICHRCEVVTFVIMGSYSPFQQQNLTANHADCVRGQKLWPGVGIRTGTRIYSFWYRDAHPCHLASVCGRNFRNNGIREFLSAAKPHC
jgi:hypothetical protein